MRLGLIALAILCGAITLARAEVTTIQTDVKTETIKYKAGGAESQSFLAYDAKATGKRPGVVIVPEFWGLNDYAKGRARQLAELGYVALATDIYGNAQVTDDAKQASAWAGALKKGDRAELRTRVQ